MFNYEFINLTPEEVEWRRQELDRAGKQAYFAPILVLSALIVLRQLQGFSSSSTKSEPSTITAFQRRISWLMSTTVISEYGPLRVQVLGVTYFTYLVWRAVHNTGNDYMHVTKACGHVAVSQLPLHYLLAIKWPKSPVTWITGLTHERLNGYHRLYGRMIHSLLAVHALMYLNFFVKINVLQKRIRDTDVQLGVAAFWSLNFLGIIALQWIRQKAYHKLFYRSHVILSALLLVILWFHVRYTRIYVAQAAVIWIGNGVLRTGASQDANVKVEKVANTLLQMKLTVTGRHLHPYVPGCHVYLNMAGLGPRTPFTVLSAKGLEGGQTEVTLVAKNSGGPMTGHLAKVASHGGPIDLQLEGPYGEAQVYMASLLEAARTGSGRFLLIAGGVGATYALPIFKTLTEAAKKVANDDNIRMLWIVRDSEEISWARSFFQHDRTKSALYLSQTHSTREPKNFGDAVHVLSRFGRPNIQRFVDDFFSGRGNGVQESGRDTIAPNQNDPVHVLVCGPPGLSRSVHEAVGKHVVSHGRNVRWYEESFGFGG